MNATTMPQTLHLPYLAPWDWQQFHQHFALRALPGVECLEPRRYSRSVRMDGHAGWFSVAPLDDEAALELQLYLDPQAAAHAQALVARVRRMFDLDADPRQVAAHLGADPLLKPLLENHPGLRLPTAFDPFEQAVRAIVGQQVTVKAAVTITGRLVERLGEPLPNARADGPRRLFPTPEALAGANLDGIGMPGKRVATLQRFAEACASGALALHVEDGAEALVQRLCALPGIGPWTAEYVALRAFGEADAFPAADLGLLKAPVWGEGGISARELARRAEAWRPWRAYAAVYLWQSYANGG
ncbi:DNA-3-methyladenine glycosylase family protein [Pseudomonas schmalbachii]|uniref:DNA-3-methyladenine glycosylase II n=1 Tax=Pseudomonas schmalbachii TaxID=2816993 RepID=A0ABS3TPQ2_9PSED|nr:DNA-3-methyladenine glycosylase [Pseudomonas schmalbachii]MBO3275627.1 DNA-3-methyladenine glycosylase 2 family protein [Pseudomonas schmalbachii]